MIDFDEHGTDEELEAEQNVVGAMFHPASFCSQGLPDPHSFCCPFNAAVAFTALGFALARGQAPTPAQVWDVVKHHSDADCFDVEYIAALADRSDRRRFADDLIAMWSRAARRMESIASGFDGALPETVQ